MTFIGSCPIHAGRMSAFWPAFCDALRREHPSLTEEGLGKARDFNAKRYYYQGIGRFAPPAAYARGLADLRVLADLLPARAYLFGPKPTSIDAAVYGFIANIYFYPIETPLKQFVASKANLVRHCTAIHELIGSTSQDGANSAVAGGDSSRSR